MPSSTKAPPPEDQSIIGLTGPAGVGKDTVASVLAGVYTRYAFAGPLKIALSCLNLFEPRTRAAKEVLLPGKPYSYRTAAQTLGTEWARRLDPDFWLKLADEKTVHLRKVVFTDVRFNNEADWVRTRGGVIWHVTGRATTVTGEAAAHASEVAVDFKDGDWTLDNSGTLEDLTSNTQDLLWRMKHG